jgi:branched-chain amino acid transport system ATP-binding protein
MTASVVNHLEASNISVSYRRLLAVDRASVSAQAGQIRVVVGPNGAGKTSLLLAINGFVRSSGEVRLNGDSIGGLPVWERAARGLGIVPQGREIFPRLSVLENLKVVAERLGLADEVVEQAMDRFPVLRERQRQLAGLLSGGEQQMLAVSRSLMSRPRVLLLDEMSTGLAPLIVERLLQTIREVADGGAAVLMAEPNISRIKDCLDGGFVMIRGRITAQADSAAALDEAYKQQFGLVTAGSE